MLQHLRLLRLFAQNSMSLNLEYRVNFAGAMVMSLMDALWSLGGALVFYSHRPTLGGWTFHETLVVIGLFFWASGLVDAIFRPNLYEAMDQVRTGALDYALIRPVNNQMLITLRHFRLERLTNVAAGVIIIAYALLHLPAPTWSQAAWFAVLTLCATALLYATSTALIAIAIWAVELVNVEELISAALEVARYPTDAFPAMLRGLLMFVLPIGFISTVPAQALVGRLQPEMGLIGIALSAAALLASRRMWQWVLSHYTSAGG